MNTRRRTLTVFLTILACQLASATRADSSGDVQSAAPVLAKILENTLEKSAAQPMSMQWAHLRGRGLVYFAGLPVESVSVDKNDDRPTSKTAAAWEAAQRELAGLPTRSNGNSAKVEAAITEVSAVIARFAGHVPLPSEEEIRVVLFSSLYARNVMKFYGQYSGSVPSLRSVMDSVIVTRDGARKPTDGIVEDAAVLARVLEARLQENFPNEYWGTGFSGQPGALGFAVGNWGPVVVLNMTFPLDNPEIGETADLWERTLRELRSGATPQVDNTRIDVDEDGELDLIASLTGVGTLRTLQSGKGVAQERLSTLVSGVLTEFGARVRGLDGSEDLHVVIYEGATSPPQEILRKWLGSMDKKKRSRVNYLVGSPWGRSVLRSPSLILRAAGVETGKHIESVDSYTP